MMLLIMKLSQNLLKDCEHVVTITHITAATLGLMSSSSSFFSPVQQQHTQGRIKAQAN